MATDYILTGQSEAVCNTTIEFNVYEFQDEIDFGELGFLNVKCIQGHGLNEAVIIGKHEEVKDSGITTDIVAKIQYTPSVLGGIGKLGGILLSENLDTYNIEYDDVDRLDSWDTETTQCDIAIVLNSHVVWIDGLILTESDSSEFHTAPSEARGHPFFTEETYGYSGTHAVPESTCDESDPNHISSSRICGSGYVCGIEYGYTHATFPQGSLNRRLVKDRNGNDVKTNVSCAMGEWIPFEDVYCPNSPSIPNATEYADNSTSRANIALFGNLLFFGIEIEDFYQTGSYCFDFTCELFRTDEDLGCNCEGGGGTLTTNYIIQVLGFTNDPGNRILMSGDSKLCSDGDYAGYLTESTGEIDVISSDGLRRQSFTNYDYTIIKQVILLPDGTATVKQTDLQPSLIP